MKCRQKIGRYFKLFQLLAGCFLLQINTSAQNVQSDDDFFKNYVNSIQKQVNDTKNLAFGIDFQLTNEYGVLSKSYIVLYGMFVSAVPSVKGFFPLDKGKKFSLLFTVPYIITTQISAAPDSLPGIENVNTTLETGIGDISAGFNWRHNFGTRTEFTSTLMLMSPSGKSVFEDTSQNFLPLGSGLWTVDLEAGLNKYLSKKMLLALDISYANRMKTKFAFSNGYNYASADPVLSAGLDIALIGNQYAFINSKFSLTYNEIYIGKTYTQVNEQLKTFNNIYRLHRFGLKWSAWKSIHSVFEIFAGGQIVDDFAKNSSYTTYLLDVQIPLGFNKIGFKFY
jgi:hypothetical protein